MKKILLIAALFLAQYGISQETVKFTTQSHKFGKIKKGVPASTIFSFKNVSEKPVVIEFAQADCGCTEPEYPKTAIAKGQSATIKVTYNAATSGVFKKSVNVKFASSTQPYILTVEGEVLMDAETKAKLDQAKKPKAK